MNSIRLTRPDDWHTHLRDGAALELTVAHAARSFARSIVMPNLVPPVTTTALAAAYRERILHHLPQGADWAPLMTLYLTDNTDPEDLVAGAEQGVVTACKLYPAGATTNSDSGVTDIDKIFPVLSAMQQAGIPLLIHGEVTDADIDIFDREAVFIERHLKRIVESFPDLKVVLEHITTRQAAEFVASAGDRVAATITAHHLMYNRNHMLVGGIRPHYYCLPILKRNEHQQALIDAATSGDASFFLGTDSAPHNQSAKETACGCAGCYTAWQALEMYATVFDQANALDKLEAFASLNGPAFYQLPVNTTQVELQRQPLEIPTSFAMGGETLVPLDAGETLGWSLVQ